jgi:hypothetical protein
MRSPDLSMVGVWGIQVPAPSIRADGVPIYDLKKARLLIDPRTVPAGLEDGELLMPSPDGILLTADAGYKNDRKVWSYPARFDYNDCLSRPWRHELSDTRPRPGDESALR